MRRLVGLPMEARQEDEVLRLLAQARIPCRVTRTLSTFLGGDAIWVPDEDYLRARELLNSEAQAFAATVRAKWNAEWDAEHKGSYVVWMWNRLRRATVSTLFRVVVLIVVVGLMLFYPVAYVLR